MSGLLPAGFAPAAPPEAPAATIDADAAVAQSPDPEASLEAVPGAEGAGEGEAAAAPEGDGTAAPEGKAAAVAPAEAPAMATLKSQVASLTEQLNSARTAQQVKAVNAKIEKVNTALEKAKQFLGDDSPVFEAFSELADIAKEALSKANDAESVTVVRDSKTAHKQARADAPVSDAIYAADANGDRTAGVYIETMKAISQAILDEQKLETIDWRDGRALASHYAEVEKRFNAMIPDARKQYFPGPKGIAATAAKKGPIIRPTEVKSPETLGTIPGGVGVRPTQPIDFSKMSPIEQAMFASANSRKPF